MKNLYVDGARGTMDFRSNGYVIVKIAGYASESYPYEVKPDSKVDTDGDIYEVRNLTASKFYPSHQTR